MAKEETKTIDYPLAVISLILITWGIFTLATVSFPYSLQKHGNAWFFFIHQLIMISIGAILGFITFKIPLKKLKKWTFFLFLATLIILPLTFLPKIGVKIGGAKRWIALGSVLIQPSEILKLTFILYLAAWLSEKTKSKKFSSKLMWPFLVILGIMLAILILQPDMTTIIIIIITGLSMYFASKTPLKHIIALFVLLFLLFALFTVTSPYRFSRVKTFLNPNKQALKQAYQINQSLIAVGSGKTFGIDKGFAFGLSRQKFGFLPHPMTDSIFAIIGEELGFFGCTILILLFLLFAWRGFIISKKLGDKSKEFERLLVLGIIIWIITQAFLNIGGIIKLLPLGGVPLPFFSYGGSHIITELIAVALLLNASKI